MSFLNRDDTVISYIVGRIVLVHSATLVFFFAFLEVLILVVFGLGRGSCCSCSLILLGIRRCRGGSLLWRIEVVIIVVDIHLV